MGNLINQIIRNSSTRIMFIIYISIIFVTGFFVIYGYFNEIHIYEKLEREKLKGIVTSLSMTIDGEQLEELMSDHPWKDDITSTNEDSNYYQIQQVLAEAKELNKLNSTMYTITFDEEEELFRYGVRSDTQVYFRHKYELFPEIIKDNYDTGGTIPQYRTENGDWISAFHPIKNSQGKTIALIQADISMDEFNAITWKHYSGIALNSIIVILIVALILIPYAKRILREDDELKLELLEQKREIESKNRDLTDSINYAKKIQIAILPDKEYIDNSLPNSFVYYKPKDIVSGDFYWCRRVNNKVLLACADCTGHGIPGALMSMIGSSILNEIVNNNNIIDDPSKILNMLELGVNEALSTKQYTTQSKDGMDISLCCFDTESMTLNYAGALRPLLIINNDGIKEIKGDRFPIGGGDSYNKENFNSHSIDIKKGDSFYMYSDGYPDQFGGPKNKKYMNKKFKELITKNRHLNPAEQSTNIDQELRNWQGENEQVDDILVIGVFY